MVPAAGGRRMREGVRMPHNKGDDLKYLNGRRMRHRYMMGRRGKGSVAFSNS